MWERLEYLSCQSSKCLKQCKNTSNPHPVRHQNVLKQCKNILNSHPVRHQNVLKQCKNILNSHPVSHQNVLKQCKNILYPHPVIKMFWNNVRTSWISILSILHVCKCSIAISLMHSNSTNWHPACETALVLSFGLDDGSLDYKKSFLMGWPNAYWLGDLSVMTCNKVLSEKK